MEYSNIKDLLEKPLWQMTGAEYVALYAYACSINNGPHAMTQTVTRITGIEALAQYLGCGVSTIYKIKHEGVLQEAIISRVGKNIVFDGEIARRCADDYQKNQRAHRKNDK